MIKYEPILRKNGDFMKRFLYGLLVLGAVQFGLAGSFGVFYQAPGLMPLSVDYQLGSQYRIAPVLGVDFDYETYAVEAFAGASYALWEADGGDFGFVSRVYVPMFDGADFVFGQMHTTAGVSLTPTGDGGVLTPVFEAGVDYDLTLDSLLAVPDVYFRVGVRW